MFALAVVESARLESGVLCSALSPKSGSVVSRSPARLSIVAPSAAAARTNRSASSNA
jgi:hypothetical protein